MTNATNGETFALETRVEELTYVSGARRVRRGESDRLEVGSGPAQDIVSGTEHTRIGGQLSEHTGGNLSTQVSRMETTVEGKLTQRLKSDTTLLGGAMTDVHTGGVFIGAGMSDDMIIGGGVRVTAPADLWLCGLIGMEEKLGSAYADGALVELYRLAFEREYATGVHVAGAAVFSGTVHATMATGFRQLFKVSTGVRNLTPGGNAEGGAAPAPRAAPPPVEEADASGALLGPSAVGMDEVDELAALEDIRYLFGDLDTTVDSGRPGNRAAVLEDLESVAKFSATGEDVGNTRALMNHLQEGAGLSDLVDGEDLRAMLLHLDENPGTLDEARMVPDELLDGQWPDRNWVESPCIDPVEPEVRYEHLLGPGSPPEQMDIGQHRATPGVPNDFDFDRASHYFNWRRDTDFRPYAIPGTSEMNAARDYVDDMILIRARTLPPEWVDDLGLSADELEQFSTDPLFAYRKMTEMEASARRSDDIAKADILRGVLNNIDVQSYSAYQKAVENAEALRDAALYSRLPETVNQTALLDVLDNELERAQRDALDYELERALAEIEELPYGGVDTLDPAVKERRDILDQKVNLYQTMGDAVAAGQDPVLYLEEWVRLAADASDVSLAQFAAMLETQAELMQTFSNRVLGFTLDVGGLRSGLGVDDFDMASAVTELSARIDEYAIDYTPGTTGLIDAFDRANERALAQLEDLPEEILARAGLTGGSGELSADIRRQIEDAPGHAYRILTEMEADARTRVYGLTLPPHGLDLLDEGAGKEDLAMADYLATVIARLDREAKLEFARAVEAAEALRAADNIPLADAVVQPAMVRAIQERLAALDATRATLDPNDAKALAQLEAEQAFLTVALRRVEEGYDPGPRLQEMVLIARDRDFWQVSEASDLKYISDAYRNVLDTLDDYPVRVVDLPSIDDVRQSGVGTSSSTWYPGEDLTDDSTLSRYSLSPSGSSDGAGSNVLFTDTQDAAYFDTANADLRRQLDISPHQLSPEDTNWIDEWVDRFGRKRPLEDTSGSDESDLPPLKRPR